MISEYFVISKTGQSEMRAIRQLAPEALKKLTPIVELTRGRKIASKKGDVDKFEYNFDSIKEFLNDISKNCMSLLVDVTQDEALSSPYTNQLVSSESGYLNWCSFVLGLREENPNAYPVIQVSPVEGEDWNSYSQKINRQFDFFSPVTPVMAYRARKNHDSSFDVDLQLLAPKIQEYTAAGNSFIVILDCEYIRVKTASLHAEEVAEMFKIIHEISPAAILVLAATSFPSSVTEVGGENEGDFPIEEVNLHSIVSSRLHNLVHVRYGDYGSVNPLRNDGIARGWRPRIDYPYGGKKIFYFREKRQSTGVGKDKVFTRNYAYHYESVANKVQADARYLNDQFLGKLDNWGVKQIKQTADSVATGSTASFWISVRMCIHIEQQVQRLHGSETPSVRDIFS